MSPSGNRDLTFLHRFEEGSLDLWRSPVDLICKYEVVKDWARLELEFALALSGVVDLRAGECATIQRRDTLRDS